MTFRQGLVAARSHIVFIAALLCASALVIWLDRQATAVEQSPVIAAPLLDEEQFPALPLAPLAALNDADKAVAQTAWRYFENNTNAETGLVNSTDQYPSTTMWDTGSYFIAVVAAHRLGIIDKAEVDARLTKALDSLSRMALFDGLIPNKAYDVRTLAMTDYLNTATERGIGWSALDLARLMVSFTLIRQDHPEHAGSISRLTGTWKLSELVRDGSLLSAAVDSSGKTVRLQEGRVGYEQYGARAFMLFGLDALQAARFETNAIYPEVEGIPVPVDRRLVGDGPSFATSEPYFLEGLEFGFDTLAHRLASNVYRAQEARFESSGILTAVSEGHLSKAPYFGYGAVWGGGEAWTVMDLEGKRLDELRTLSTKAVFAWDALFGTDYTRKLREAVADLEDAGKGWHEGRYEADGEPNTALTGNTNSVVLASLAARAFGPLLRMPALGLPAN